MLRELPGLAGARLALAAARAASAHLCGGATFAPGSRYLGRRVVPPAGQRAFRVFVDEKEGSGCGPGVFDGQGKRSIESAHFPPSGLGAMRPGGRGERGRGRTTRV
jgi:hypothetical protein